MEHREPPRIATADDPSHESENDPIRGRRFARFVTPPSVRRLSRPRIVLAILAGAGFLYVLSLAGLHGLRSLRTFVHKQAEYQVAFSEIVLDPPPPGWYKGGSKHFLERVRKESGDPEQFSLLDLDTEKLKLAFQRDGWVRKAVVMRQNPNRVVVHLDYREPVALVSVEHSRKELIDQEAVILNQDDVNLNAAATLFLERRGGSPSLPPFLRNVGETWKTESGPNKLPVVDECVLAGAKLANFLRSVQRDDLIKRSPNIFQAVVAESESKLWVQSGDHLLVFWGMPPNEERPGELPFSEKWKVLTNWIKQYDQSVNDPRMNYYFEFKGDQVKFTAMRPSKK
ncbi:cell division protein FtsQ/DivIB [Singulisphaera acidiphila]|uniref:Cell division septal protein n=1 Tax=Singulisphaera acidiphila (strain ATCC BAA-1392 / DSM 18658 / VKM B-2454 / MOB10) TaxID=886293 RepID=L0DN47_SINAD|nr:FtsQ-type POTRA domain-containing protein [Singulisphaera acidiphila]AGA30250.1 cell division septal protein [Singulisphaera acidiphila DSM 18658]